MPGTVLPRASFVKGRMDMSENYSEYAVEVQGGFLRKEYEVIYLDGALEISAIYNKSRRKRKFLCDMKNVLGFCLGQKEEALRLGKITADFSSRVKGREVCVLKAKTEKGTAVVCFEPGEEIAGILNRQYRQLRINR